MCKALDCTIKNQYSFKNLKSSTYMMKARSKLFFSYYLVLFKKGDQTLSLHEENAKTRELHSDRLINV